MLVALAALFTIERLIKEIEPLAALIARKSSRAKNHLGVSR
jgi:hypothetical protein